MPAAGWPNLSGSTELHFSRVANGPALVVCVPRVTHFVNPLVASHREAVIDLTDDAVGLTALEFR